MYLRNNNFRYWVQWLRLALLKGSNWAVSSLPSSEEGNLSSGLSAMFPCKRNFVAVNNVAKKTVGQTGSRDYMHINNSCPQYTVLLHWKFPRLGWNLSTYLPTWRMASSGTLDRVALVRADILEELSASFIRVTRIGERGTTLAVTNNRLTLRVSVFNFTLIRVGPPLWYSSQSFWLLTQMSRVRFPALPDFLSSSGSGKWSTQPLWE
jgi:hypothetical protein